jgi:hypothetical protein
MTFAMLAKERKGEESCREKVPVFAIWEGVRALPREGRVLGINGVD